MLRELQIKGDAPGSCDAAATLILAAAAAAATRDAVARHFITPAMATVCGAAVLARTLRINARLSTSSAAAAQLVKPAMHACFKLRATAAAGRRGALDHVVQQRAQLLGQGGWQQRQQLPCRLVCRRKGTGGGHRILRLEKIKRWSQPCMFIET